MPKLDLGKVVPQKGTDYFTQQDINDIVNTTMTDLQPLLDEKADIEDIPDVSGFITKDVNNLTNYYDKTTVDSKVSSVYKYKGSVATYDQLPSTGLTVGDVYNVEDTGDNYAWTGTTWDKLGGNIDVSNLQTKITSTNKLDSDLVDDTSSTNKFVSTAEKTTWNGKQNTLTAGNNITISNDIISAKDKVINVDLYKSASTPLVLEDLEVGAYMLKSSNMTSSETLYMKARRTDTTTSRIDLTDFSHYFPLYKLNEFESGKNAIAYVRNSEMTFKIDKYDENSTSGISSSGLEDIYKFFRTARNQYNSVASNNDYSGANNYTTLPTSSVAPTSDNQFANKKYVDDQVAPEIYFIDTTNSSSSPFVFEGKKKGIYVVKSASGMGGNNFYYKVNNDSNVKSLTNMFIFEIELYEDIPKITETTSNKIKFKYFAYSSGNIGDYKISQYYFDYVSSSNVSISMSGTSSFGQFVSSGRQTYSGLKIFSTIPRQSDATAPTQDNEFANKKYVDDQVAGAGGGGSAVFIVDFSTATTSAQQITAFNEWYQYYKTGNDDWQLIWKNGYREFTNPIVYEDTNAHKLYVTYTVEVGTQSKNNGSSLENIPCQTIGYLIFNISNGNISSYADYSTAEKSPKYQYYAGASALNAPLGTSNNYAYTPTNNYNPATKKYVDDSIANVRVKGTYDLDLTTLNKTINYSDFNESDVLSALTNILNQAYTENIDLPKINIKWSDTNGISYRSFESQMVPSLLTKPSYFIFYSGVSTIDTARPELNATWGRIYMYLSWSGDTCTVTSCYDAEYSTITIDDEYQIDEKIENKATTINSNIAPEYDSSQTYDVGDCVIYDSELYSCINAISTPEEFDDSNWERTTLFEAIKNL